MAIPLPNPNINDFDTNDVQTWSSAHIAAGLTAAGVAVGLEGTVNPKKMTLLADVILNETSDSYTLIQTDLTMVFAIVSVNFDLTTSTNFSIIVTTPEQSTAFIAGAYCNRSYTGGSDFKNTLYSSCKSGLALGWGCVSAANSNGPLTMNNNNAYTNNIVASKYSTVTIKCADSMPIGTKIKVYGY